jgi:hypothetical protein
VALYTIKQAIKKDHTLSYTTVIFQGILGNAFFGGIFHRQKSNFGEITL